ncbi:hypothetical protein KI387_009849, partial [Taxus chinensis]
DVVLIPESPILSKSELGVKSYGRLKSHGSNVDFSPLPSAISAFRVPRVPLSHLVLVLKFPISADPAGSRTFGPRVPFAFGLSGTNSPGSAGSRLFVPTVPGQKFLFQPVRPVRILLTRASQTFSGCLDSFRPVRPVRVFLSRLSQRRPSQQLVDFFSVEPKFRARRVLLSHLSLLRFGLFVLVSPGSA